MLPLNNALLLQQADRCVKCGLCLAVCPTYAIARNEADSPRGRIALIQGLAEQRLPLNDTLEQHLRSCLHCLNCQAACPSGVEYNLIIEAGLSRLPRRQKYRLDALSRWPQRPWLQEILRALNPAWAKPMAERLTWGKSKRMLQLLGRIERPVRPDKTPRPNTVALFLGCIGQINDSPAHRAFLDICSALSIPVQIPSEQRCCGALHRHQGQQEASDQLRMHNEKAFAQAEVIVGLSSGCGAELKQQFSAGYEDASQFLVHQNWPSDLDLRPLAQTVAIHTPCSLRNGLGSEQCVWQLLKKIPEIQLESVESPHGCCGGAGLQTLDQPQLADQLAAPLVETLAQRPPHYLVTSNSGCALHLRRALRLRNLPVEVLHPVELVARQLPSATMKSATTLKSPTP